MMLTHVRLSLIIYPCSVAANLQSYQRAVIDNLKCHALDLHVGANLFYITSDDFLP